MHERNGSVVFLFLSGFSDRMMLASYNEWGSVPFSLIFWKSFREIGVFSLKCSPAIFSGPGIFFVIRFLVIPLISLKPLGFQVSFGSFCLSKNLLHLSCWTYWHKVVDICWMCSDVASLISVVGNACYLPFFLISLARGVSVWFLIFSEN